MLLLFNIVNNTFMTRSLTLYASLCLSLEIHTPRYSKLKNTFGMGHGCGVAGAHVLARLLHPFSRLKAISLPYQVRQ